MSTYLILSGLWKIAAFILLIRSCVYWVCKDGKKDQYCRYCPCVWRVYVFVLVVFGGCFLLCSFGMVFFIFITSIIIVYGSFQSYTNPTMNQTLQCSPAIYYSFVSVTFIYFFFGVIAIITVSVYFLFLYKQITLL